jgi:hypothetical protein
MESQTLPRIAEPLPLDTVAVSLIDRPARLPTAAEQVASMTEEQFEAAAARLMSRWVASDDVTF